MTTQKLAFLENFYTDVTLYVPAEPVAAVTQGEAQVQEETAAQPPQPPLKATPPAVQPLPPATPPAAAVSRLSSQTSTSFSKPSAGLERLVAKELVPIAVASDTVAAPAPATRAVPGVPPAQLTPFSVLGTNKLGVVLLFRLQPELFVRLHRNVFLNKMLQALGYVMEDVLLVNVEADLPVALTSLRRELSATNIIAFGKNLLDVTIRNTQIYEPVQFPSLGLSYLASATVDLVEYDVSLKKRLWPGLQAMFLR